MKKKIITTAFIILLITIICIAVVLCNRNLNIFKLKSVEKNALEYINQTYPDFIVSDISVRHEWKPNHYVVDYDDGKGDSRTVIFNHTGEDLFADEYIDSKAWKIIYDYEKSIKLKITEALKRELGIDAYYVTVDDRNVIGKEKEIVLEGLDISSDSVTCSIGIIGDDNSTTFDFATLLKEIYTVVFSLDLPIEKMEVIQHNSPDSRFDIVCPVNMSEMSIEEINELIRK